MACPYCGSDVGKSGICERCGGANSTTPFTGWRPDPTARHEGRYYLGGRPTGRIRNGKAEANDADGGKMLPGYLDAPPRRSGWRSAWLGTGAATAVVVMLAAVLWGLWHTHHKEAASPEADYLAALHDSGLAAQFNSDANALAHGRQVCHQLDDGGPQQGVPADKIAVDSFCPKFAQGFHVLETVTVPGIFVLSAANSNGYYIDSISSDGTTCQGVEGYSDIGRDTQVTVKNGKGEILATTALGEGHGTDASCTFSFTFPVTDGQDRYVVSVGHRGEFSYTFNQLQAHGVEVHLGG